MKDALLLVDVVNDSDCEWQVGAGLGLGVVEERLVQVAQLRGGLERVVVPDREASFVPPDHLLRPLERHVDVPLECRTRLRLDISRRGEHPLDEVEQLGERLERAGPEILLEARVLALHACRSSPCVASDMPSGYLGDGGRNVRRLHASAGG